MTLTQRCIASELYKALENLGATPNVLGVLESWGDELNDKEVLALLQYYNYTGTLESDPARIH